VEHKRTVHPAWPSFTSERGRAIRYGAECCPRTLDILSRFAGVSLAPTARGQFFNPLAFTTPPPISPGTSGVGTFTGPYVFVTDLSLRKYFKLSRESMGLTFESDFFNVFNRANYSLGSLGNATLTVGSGNFGGFGSASNPRNVQFGLKFNF